MSSDSTLTNFINNNQKYMKIKDGDSITAIFTGCEQVTKKDNFSKDPNETRDTIEYHLTVDGVERVWDNGTWKVAEQMVGKEGKNIKISRRGNGAQTVYTITEA